MQRPEESLLIAVTCPEIEPRQIEQIKTLLAKNIDWSYFLRISRQHKVLSLVYLNFNHFFAADIPESVLLKLLKHFETLAQHTLLMKAELSCLMDLFKQHGIAAIPYKGPVLGMLLYGNTALRQFRDLDILIDLENVSKAQEILLKRGYTPLLCLSPVFNNFLVNQYNAKLFLKGRLQVDLHWNMGMYPENSSWTLQEIPFAGKTIQTFSLEDLVLILTLHAAKHAWNQLNWIGDIAQLMRNSSIDWQKIREHAKTLKNERILLISLSLAHDLYQAPLTDKIKSCIYSDPRVKKITKKIKAGLFQRRNGWNRLMDDCIYVSALENTADKIRHMMSFIKPTQADWAAVPLPNFLYPLYYLIRPLRLFFNIPGRFVFKQKRNPRLIQRSKEEPKSASDI
jgi:hypothetical protein